MNSKEIKELKQRLTLDSCTITKMKGVYVGSNNEIVARLDKNFLNLPEDEFFKYLEYAKEIFQPKQVDNKDLTLNITGDSDIKNILNRIVDNELKKTTTEEEELYNKIIKYYGHTNGYLILLFYDIYDVPVVTRDNLVQDDSEDIYRYIICAICPLKLTDPAMGYEEKDNTFRSVERDWIVCKPDEGFVYPAFNDRASDEESILYYTSTPQNPDHSFIQNVIECDDKLTITEYKDLFKMAFEWAIDSVSERDRYYSAINATLQGYSPEDVLSTQMLINIMSSCGMPKEYIDRIAKEYVYDFGEYGFPKIGYIYQEKYKNMHYVIEQKNKARRLLTQASNALNHNGGSELADEIEDYLNRTR